MLPPHGAATDRHPEWHISKGTPVAHGDGIRESAVRGIIEKNYTAMRREEIKGSGYCIESLTAALWAFFSTNDFKSAILRAVNLGDDADTTAAICGQLAGAYYGVEAIPRTWRKVLAMTDYIDQTARRLFASSQEWPSGQ
jgi:ADP-ribosyl-[dinitrogen reductase] hydrolase